MNPYRVLRYPYITEKTISMMDRENKIVFVVDRKAKKKDIKKAFEKVFGVKVEKVNTQISPKGEKRAYIKLKPEFKARDVATKLGII